MTTFHVMSSDRSMTFDSYAFVDDVAVLTSFFGIDESASTCTRGTIDCRLVIKSGSMSDK